MKKFGLFLKKISEMQWGGAAPPPIGALRPRKPQNPNFRRHVACWRRPARYFEFSFFTLLILAKESKKVKDKIA